MRDTLGNCPICGHQESSYDDWIYEGYREDPKTGQLVRAFRCAHCQHVVTPDSDDDALMELWQREAWT